MTKLRLLTLLISALLLPINVLGHGDAVFEDNPRVICNFLDRIGGKGASKRFAIRLEMTAPQNEAEYFSISSKGQKPFIQGNSLTAITTGINWYLNHYAHINISWNQLTVNLRKAALPIPLVEERHTCNVDYRYYLNYCTFCYSMATWTWERWEQEIDWMALHGINMPLQIIGLEKVWRDLLMQDYGYSEDEAENFIPGPAYIAWWGMNNLEGWAGTHNNAWFDRQAKLAKKICDRERELGMQPVLPGFCGMVPSNFKEKTGKNTEKANSWCGFQRPAILDPSGSEFAVAAERYYARLAQVMGVSKYYSMDPFHEGGTISSGRYKEGYRAVFDAMNKNCGEEAKWVIQQWQWTAYQTKVLSAVPSGRLIVLDLYSDGKPDFEKHSGYTPHDAIYCTIPNFGGRTGIMGRLPKMADNFYKEKRRFANIKGIGAAPEAIESVPVVYDLLFEMPWMQQEPDIFAWINHYAEARYGKKNEHAKQAWQNMLRTIQNESTALQGPHESVMCGRPSLNLERVSSWGGTQLFYDREHLVLSAAELLQAADEIGTEGSIGAQNMSYDLTDVIRQCLSDYSKVLLDRIKKANEQGDQSLFARSKNEFLQLILDTDRLLGTNRLFRLGNWTESARKVAREVRHGGQATADWLELDNARTLITTWGDFIPSEKGGLRDYSCRQWQGLLKDYYYERWKYWFDHNMQAPLQGWFYSEWNWSHELESKWGDGEKGQKMWRKRHFYRAKPEGETKEIADEIFHKYLSNKGK